MEHSRTTVVDPMAAKQEGTTSDRIHPSAVEENYPMSSTATATESPEDRLEDEP